MAKNIQSEKTINQIAFKLGDFLADTFVLYVKTLNYHWNMTGANFYLYHKLLETQYQDLSQAADEVAERIRMLGRQTPATMGSFLKLASLKEGASGLSQDKMIKDLVDSHETMIEQCNMLIHFTQEGEAYDQGTADLIIKQIRFHEKQVWLLKSHIN